MPHMIESAKSSRANCRACKKPIAKGELRFGEEVANAFAPGEMTYNWFHLECAAQKKPAALKQALDANGIEVPNKDELMKTIEVAGKTARPSTYPFAEHAPTGRASCLACSEKIDKDALRVAIETDVEGGGFTSKRPAYLHPSCTSEHVGDDELFDKIKANSLNLTQEELEFLEEELA